MGVFWLVLSVFLLGLEDRPETVDLPRLYGIASLVVAADSIEVTKDATLPPGMVLRKQGQGLARATIKVGESFEVTDGHHLGHGFKLLAIEKGVAKLQTTFWTAFLGAKPTSSTSAIQLRSYVTRKKKQ